MIPMPSPRLLRKWVEDNHVRTETYLPGAVLLRKWLDDNKVTAHRFAIDNRIDQGELSKLLRGRRGGVGVEFAVKVEDATGGDVPVRSWVPRKLEVAA
jgi:hypothetical protein